MNGKIERKILELRKYLDSEFSMKLPVQYLEFLKKFDGLASCGIFIYSSRPHRFPGGDGYSHDFIEINKIARDMKFMENFLIFGDSDQDEYVLEIAKGKFQVRDKQAFDNVFEEFDCFDGLLDFMIDLVHQRA